MTVKGVKHRVQIETGCLLSLNAILNSFALRDVDFGDGKRSRGLPNSKSPSTRRASHPLAIKIPFCLAFVSAVFAVELVHCCSKSSGITIYLCGKKIGKVRQIPLIAALY